MPPVMLPAHRLAGTYIGNLRETVPARWRPPSSQNVLSFQFFAVGSHDSRRGARDRRKALVRSLADEAQ